MAYRNISKSNKDLTVTDVVYLKGGKMLYLLYPMDRATMHYFVNAGSIRYNFTSRTEWIPGNWPMACQYMRQFCDQMTFSIWHAATWGWKNVR